MLWFFVPVRHSIFVKEKKTFRSWCQVCDVLGLAFEERYPVSNQIHHDVCSFSNARERDPSTAVCAMVLVTGKDEEGETMGDIDEGPNATQGT